MVPNDQLRVLYAHNALGILSHMAAETDAAYFHGSRPSENDEPPAVTREVISIELEAERGPLVERPPSPRRKASPAPGKLAATARGGEGSYAGTPAAGKCAATPNAAESQKTFIRAPVPRRQHGQATHLDKSPPQQQQLEGQAFHGSDRDRDHECPPRHPATSRSPAFATIPGEGGRESVGRYNGDEKGDELGPEAEARAETTRFMWHLCRNAQRYGLTPQPTTSQRPVLSGTIMARQPTVGPCLASSPSTICRDDGCTVVRSSTETLGADGDGGAKVSQAAKAGKFPVCTFVLTTLDDHENAPRDGIATSLRVGGGDDGAGDKPEAAEVNRSFDVVLYVIEGARPMSCRSWNGEGSAVTGVRGRDWWADGPFPEDVALHASQLVERLLRLAIAQRRRDSVWELFDLDNPWSPFKNAVVVSSVSPPTPPSLAASPPVDASLTPPPAAAGSRAPETAFHRVPSPAFSYTSIVGDFSGYQNHALEGCGVPHVSELNLRDLLEVSVVTPLGVALPALARVIDPRHGVDWGGWFQHLADSPAMRTLVFEDGDSVLARPAGTLDGALDGEEGCVDDEGARPVLRPPARRVLLALPTLLAPDRGDEAAGGIGGGSGGGDGVAENEGGGEGPWVGATHTGAGPRAAHAGASMLFCVILHKVRVGHCLGTGIRCWSCVS